MYKFPYKKKQQAVTLAFPGEMLFLMRSQERVTYKQQYFFIASLVLHKILSERSCYFLCIGHTQVNSSPYNENL